MPGGALEGEQDLGPSAVFVGRKLDEHRGAFVLEYPMDKGVVTESGWDSMERLWEVRWGLSSEIIAHTGKVLETDIFSFIAHLFEAISEREA